MVQPVGALELIVTFVTGAVPLLSTTSWKSFVLPALAFVLSRWSGVVSCMSTLPTISAWRSIDAAWSPAVAVTLTGYWLAVASVAGLTATLTVVEEPAVTTKLAAWVWPDGVALTSQPAGPAVARVNVRSCGVSLARLRL